MSLARDAARGALWTVITSIGGRVIGVIGTLVLTRFLSPAQLGEVQDAAILCLTASWLTLWGFGQYVVVEGRGPHAREVAWHATVFYVGLGVVSLGPIALVGGRLLAHLDAPEAASYVPGLALAMFLRRIAAMPERILTLHMRFRAIGVSFAIGELAFTASAVALAALGLGGGAMVVANLVRAATSLVVLARAAGLRSWLTPAPLRLARVKDMVRYGLPLGVQGLAHMASRYWDNFAVSYYFGTGALGAYNLAYNLADIPAVQIGEQVALVLLPSMAGLPQGRRARALERSAALLSVVVLPLAVGLALIADPLIAWLLPSDQWQEVAPLMSVLACLSVFRPITWVLSTYMEAEARTGRLLILELAKLALLLGGIGVLAPCGLRVAAAAVGISFGVTAAAGVALVARRGPSAARLADGFGRPLAACAAMALAVWLTRRGLAAVGVDSPGAHVAAEVGVGGVAYVAAALAICRETSRDLVALLARALAR